MSKEDFTTTNKGHRALIKTTELNQDWQQLAVDVYAVASEKFTENKDIAEFIKKEFDLLHTGVWHCIVGKDFGCYVSHLSGGFSYFHIESKGILLFRTR
ncbi:Dynein light chain flagellar outer arm [Fasciola gigantica]|uniref:Dynein light chain n=1 Tax=Fasciola gigantica TaxID=46835 RepID=A0A504YKS8_FASGI|nr:Dynein light chain flagellar outer arm [Fasciola gigantica]